MPTRIRRVANQVMKSRKTVPKKPVPVPRGVAWDIPTPITKSSKTPWSAPRNPTPGLSQTLRKSPVAWTVSPTPRTVRRTPTPGHKTFKTSGSQTNGSTGSTGSVKRHWSLLTNPVLKRVQNQKISHGERNNAIHRIAMSQRKNPYQSYVQRRVLATQSKGGFGRSWQSFRNARDDRYLLKEIVGLNSKVTTLQNKWGESEKAFGAIQKSLDDLCNANPSGVGSIKTRNGKTVAIKGGAMSRYVEYSMSRYQTSYQLYLRLKKLQVVREQLTSMAMKVRIQCALLASAVLKRRLNVASVSAAFATVRGFPKYVSVAMLQRNATPMSPSP